MTTSLRERISDPLIVNILAIVRQLLPIEDLDQLLKAGVELPRQFLGVERCALWMLNSSGTGFRGTWGTDMQGQTTDERNQFCSIADFNVANCSPFHVLEGWSLRQGLDRMTWTPEGNRIEGCGWNTVIPLTGPEGNVGAFFQDAAISDSPLDPHLQDMMAIYCSLLGQLAGRRLAEKREFFLSHGLEEVLACADELMTYDDLDTLHRRIVELARERLGVVRCGLFLTSPDDVHIFCGTWGTDWDGNTTDEHRGGFDIRIGTRAEAGKVEVYRRRWSAMENFRMSWFTPEGVRIEQDNGWNAMHPLAVKDRTLGVLCTDPGSSGEPLDPRKMDLLTTYCDLAARILDRHQTQEGLRVAKQAAEQATKTKGDFLASMSHEIRTPFTGVLGLLKIALRDSMLTDATRQTLQLALGNAESLQGIINDILDFSKIEAGKLTLEQVDFSLPGLVDSALSVLGSMAQGHSLGFDVFIAPEVPRFVKGDPTRVRQILVNLVGNAIKFTEQGCITVKIALLETNAVGCVVLFSIIDSGIGMSPEVLQNLFTKFEQADMSTTRRFGGTGLGLAISKELAEAMGGSIEVESEVGRGTTFCFQVSFLYGQEVVPVAAPELMAHTHRLRVLCAEDYPTTQLIVRTLLEDRGHCVDIVGNGLLALQLLATNDYDLVLMDSRMPLMDGLEAVRHLREGRYKDLVFRDRAITTIAFTANVSREDREKFLKVGVDDFLAKPIDEPSFHRVLEATIRRQLELGKSLQPLVYASPSSLDNLFDVEPECSPPPSAYSPLPLQPRLEAVFRSTLPDRIQEIHAAINRADLGELGRLFHGLKGAAGYLKNSRLSELALNLENLSDHADLIQVQRSLPTLLTELQIWLPAKENL